MVTFSVGRNGTAQRVTPARPAASRRWVGYVVVGLLALGLGFGLGQKGEPQRPTKAEATKLIRAQQAAPAGWVCWLANNPSSDPDREREVTCAAG